jgi:hypothetical protein
LDVFFIKYEGNYDLGNKKEANYLSSPPVFIMAIPAGFEPALSA